MTLTALTLVVGSLPTGLAGTRAYAAPSVSGLHVDGNRLVNDVGEPVRLLGVNRSGSEYMCIQDRGFFEGPSDAASVDAIAAWNVTAVRIPLNEDCWLGINGAPPAYSGPAYQTAIHDYVDLVTSRGMAAIIELHWSGPGTDPATGQQPMPDRDHTLDFWASVANTFQFDQSVVFDLFNEPYPDNNTDTTAAWQCWRDGGSACPDLSFDAVGMQELVDVVRGVGASNVILLGGVGYSNSLSQWLTYAPTDPAANLAASWHVYDFNGCITEQCWRSMVLPVARSVPLVASEIGGHAEEPCSTDFTNHVMTWLDSIGASYLAWSWDIPFGPPWPPCFALVSDYDGAPTAPYGVAFKDHLSQVVVAGKAWRDVGDLATPRAVFTLTPLADGGALAVGGGGTSGTLASAERFDPVSGQWTSAGSLTSDRYGHTATRIADGDVVVAGGRRIPDGAYLNSAERYDAATNSWSSAGVLPVGAKDAAAAPLADGGILVVGGQNGALLYDHQMLASAQRYDSATNSWNSVSPLAEARVGASATLLDDGSVLVAGGYDNSRLVTTAERYDPGTDTWSSAGVLVTGRYGHTATLLTDGRVLVAGGTGWSTGFMASAEIYDPASNSWATTGPMSTARFGHNATRLSDGRVLVTSGDEIISRMRTDIYDPNAQRWEPGPPVDVGVMHAAATLLDGGSVLLTGGTTWPYCAESAGCTSSQLSGHTQLLESSLDVPSAPLGPVATGLGSGATVSWAPPATDGAAPVDGYTVTSSPGGETCTTTPPETTCSMGGLSNGSTYVFWVTAHNVFGDSPATATPPVVPASIPDQVSNVIATPGNASATVSWDAPFDQGAPIDGYTVTASPGGAACSPPSPATLTCDVLGLSNGSFYTFTVTAHNSQGTSYDSNPTPPVLIGYPGWPNEVTLTAGDGTATLSFLPPATDGGFPIVDYLGSCTSSDGGAAVSHASAASPLVVTGLDNGRSYSCSVKARNALGSGAASVAGAVVTTFAGSGTNGTSNGIGAAAQFTAPRGLASDAAGNLYVGDTEDRLIRKITPAGVVTTLAGSPYAVGFVNGTGSAARFNYLVGVTVDVSGNVYVADAENNAIRKISAAGVVTTLAGTGAPGFVNGSSSVAKFYAPIGVAVDAAGNVYVADLGNSAVRKITPGGDVTTLAGSGSRGFVDGVGASAQFDDLRGIVVDASGNVFVTDSGNDVIRKISPLGVVSTFAGTGSYGYLDGPGNGAQFAYPVGLGIDATGTLFVGEYGNERVRRVSTTGEVSTLAGSGVYGYLDGAGSIAQFRGPASLAVDSSGHVFVGDHDNHMIRKIADGSFRFSGASVSSSGGSVSSAPAATPANPITATVVVPPGGSGGTVTITQSAAATVPAPSGFGFVGQELRIEAPAATAAAPLSLTFRLDASALGGAPLSQLTVFRDGVAVAPCTATSPAITPDPCRASAAIDAANGNAVITVLTSHASTWDVGVATSPVTIVDQTITFTAVTPASPHFLDGSFTASATASSGLPVSYASTTPDVCAVNSTTGVATILHAGSCTITVNQPGNSNYNPAQGVQTTIIARSDQVALAVSAPASGVYGQVLALSTTGGSGTGGVTYSTGLSTACSVSSSSLSITSGAGTCQVTASRAADTDFNAATSNAVSIAIAKAATTSDLTVSAAATVYGQPVTISVTVSPVALAPSNPTGSLSVTDGVVPVCAGLISAGQFACTTSALTVGMHHLSASYAGDSNFSANGSTAVTTSVAAGNAQVTLSSSSGTTVFGQPVTFASLVGALAPSTTVPTGTVSFFDGATPLCAAIPLVAGLATCTSASLGLGSHSITSRYSGDSGYNAATSSIVSETVGKAPTTTSLTSSANPSVKGQSITFRATPSATPSVATPTGTVTFKAGGITLCASAALVAGSANCTTSVLPIGTTSISATYNPTGNFLGSSAPAVAQRVVPIQTTTRLTSSVNPTVTGQPTVLRVTVAPVAPGAGTPAGFVTLYDGGSPLVTLLLSGGTASTSRTFSVGTHALTASYSGGLNYSASASPVVSQLGGPAATSVALKTSAATSPAGRSVTFTATARPVAPAAGTPTGTVTFSDGSTPIGTVVLGSAGSASMSTSALTRGTHTVTARYNGSASYLTSTSPALTQRIT